MDKINSIIKNKKNSKLIFESIKRFSKEYAEENNTPFLEDQIFDTKLEEILCVLQNKIISDLIKKKKIKLDEIAFMKPEELHPDKFEKILKRKQLEEEKIKNKATASSYKCSKCGSKRCVVSEKQTRSGDEAATIIVECLECGNTFRF